MYTNLEPLQIILFRVYDVNKNFDSVVHVVTGSIIDSLDDFGYNVRLTQPLTTIICPLFVNKYDANYVLNRDSIVTRTIGVQYKNIIDCRNVCEILTIKEAAIRRWKNLVFR